VVDEPFANRAARLSNWDRWGGDDELGTLNFITAEKIAAAAQLVRRGQVFALGIGVDANGPQRGRLNRSNPMHFVTAQLRDNVRPDGSGTADDVVLLPTQAGTQWDGLAHKSHDGVMYNGRSHDLVTSAGAAANAIRAVSDRIITRGVLVDLARWHRVAELEPGYEITTTELTRALDEQHVDVDEGDILLVRTGHLERSRRNEWRGYYDTAPGLGVDTLDWIHERRLAGVASDTGAVEVRPSRVTGIQSPFHVLALVYMGLLLGEVFDLAELATACAVDHVYDFLLVGAPLPITGGIASPVNPYAVR
jgi:kynurenine formamidase